MVNKKQNKNSLKVLDSALEVMEYVMEVAGQKEDIDAMIAVADRLLMVYQTLSDSSIAKFKPGFTLNEKEDNHDGGD